jgi:gamma-glutamylcyclotransferase (GGCT)/AIG2-like uncharacterized protein YtfP
MTTPAVYQLFVYGSLRSGFRHPAYEYISRFFNLVAIGKVRGRLFDMGNYPAGVPADEDFFITGELYRVKNEAEFSWAIGQLDDYEGVKPEPGEATLYRRELVEVLVEGETTSAWIYWYNGDTTGRPRIMSGDLLQHLGGNG